MANCHNCNAEVKSHPNKKEGIPHFCFAAECRVELRRMRNKLRWDKIKAERTVVVSSCESCGEAVVARYFNTPPKCGIFCSRKACLIAKNRKRFEMRKDERDGRVQLNCETCMYQSNCSERVKLGMFVVCETPDKRDELVLELSPERGRMMELIEEARVL